MSKKKCCIESCDQTNNPTSLRVFKFPQPENLRKQWIENCGFEEETFDDNGKRICEKHFVRQCLGKYRLRLGAVPTLCLGPHAVVHSCNLKATKATHLLSGNKCTICHISKRSHPSITFYKFPSDQQMASLWMNACNLGENFDIKNRIICEQHFEPHFLIGARHMPKGVVPTLNLINDPLNISKQQKSVYEIEKEYFSMSNSKTFGAPNASIGNITNYFFLENSNKDIEKSAIVSTETFSTELTCRACLKNGSFNDTMIQIFANNIDSSNAQISQEFKYMALEVLHITKIFSNTMMSDLNKL